MKKKKLLTIGASSLMLLNSGLLPATALAEEKAAGTEEVAPETKGLTTDSLSEALPESSAEPVQETTESKEVPTSEVPATEKEDTSKDNEEQESKTASIKPMDLGLIAWGKIGLKTSTDKELVINNQKTEGILTVDLNIT